MDLIGTSLSAWDQVNQTRNKSRKRLWTIAFILGTLLALYQSANIATTYIQSSMNVIETQVIDDENPFVTVCENNHQPYIEDTDNYDYPIERDQNLMEKLSSECDPWKATLFCLSLLTERERFSLGSQLKKIFSLHYSLNEYATIESSFNSLYYGNCLTFSPTDNIIGIKFKFVWRFNHTWIMVIHEKGTLPVFKKENIIYVDSFDFQATYSITKIQVERQHWPFDSECQELGEADYLEYPDLNGLKFKYSYEGCLDQCVYELTKEYCKCIQPTSTREVNSNRLPICEQWCNQIPDEVLGKMCNCKVPCQFLKFFLRPQFISNEEGSYIIDKILRNGKPTSDLPKNRSLTIDDFLIGKTKDSSSHMHKANVLIHNHRSAIISEATSISIIDVLSAVGGIWGLWIGLSVSVLISAPTAVFGKCQQSVLKKIKTHNIIRKVCSVVWYFTLIIVVGIATWQIYTTVTDYFEYKVIQVSTTEDSDPSTFPPLFLCSETFVHFSPTVLNDANLTDVVKFFNETRHLRRNTEDYYQKYYYYLEITDAKKVSVLPRVEDLITSCQYQLIGFPRVNCTLTFRAVPYHQLMKACIKINPPIEQNFQIQEMYMQLKFPTDELSTKELVTTISFHPFFMFSQEIAQNRLSLNFISIKTGDFIDIKYDVKQIRRMKSPYVTKCVEKTSNYTFWSLKMEHDLPAKSFFYNYEDCLKLCALYKSEKLRKSEIFDDKHIISNLSDCECKQPCKENIYEYEITQSKNTYKENFMHKKYQSYEDLVSFITSGYAVVRIRRASSHMEVLTEKPLIEDESLIGLIGGILGLWIGSSILSLLVEFQAIGAACFTKCKQALKRKTNRL